ncbi:MAG: hypothetical protein ABSH16_00075 [Sedimentisphaerales bacterium]
MGITIIVLYVVTVASLLFAARANAKTIERKKVAEIFMDIIFDVCDLCEEKDEEIKKLKEQLDAKDKN